MTDNTPITGDGVASPLEKRTFGCYAHFPGTGPRGETCNSCTHLDRLKSGPVCRKWQALMTRFGKKPKAQAISSQAAACKYWQRGSLDV